MEARLNYAKLSQEPLKGMYAVNGYLAHCGLEPSLLELVKVRASQINGCAFCLDMHTKDARAHGETEQRLYGLTAWRETPFYSNRERAALAWTEAVTRISEGVSDLVFEQARKHFSEQELADLTWAVVLINGWNRLAIAFQVPPGSYKPPVPAESADRPAAAGRASD